MAFPQILTVPTPLRRSPSLKKTGKRLKRAVVSKTQAIKSYYRQTARSQYFLPAAFRDLKKAAAKNEDIVLASAALTFILTYACAVVGAQFFFTLSRTLYALSEATKYDMGLLILLVGPIVAIFCILLAAMSFNFMSLAIMDGANRKIYRSIRSTFARSLAAASRMTCAWFLLGLVHIARLLAVLIPMSIFVKYLSGIAILPLPALIAIGVISGMWLIAGWLKYSLVPYVALYEPQYLLDQAFGRSRQLVNRQARVFIITGLIILAAYNFGLYKLCVFLQDSMGSGANLLFILGLLASIMLANGAMVMLYRKRKLARR